MKLDNEDKIIVLFDGVCNLCEGIVYFIIKHDLKDRFRFAALKSDVGQKLLLQYSIDINKNDSVIVIKNNTSYNKSRAVLKILLHLRTFWRFLLVFYLVPYPLIDVLYFLVAKNRYFFFGKKKECMMPKESINNKFLS